MEIGREEKEGPSGVTTTKKGTLWSLVILYWWENLKNMENMGVFYQNMGGNMGNTGIKGNMGVVGALRI